MATLVASPYRNQHMVYCDSEEDMENTIEEFETYLRSKGLRVYVSMGTVDIYKYQFDFRLNQMDEEMKQEVFAFFKTQKGIKGTSRYRVSVNQGGVFHHYPFNQLYNAVLLGKVLEREMLKHAIVSLWEYAPFDRTTKKHEGWRLWKDRNGKSLSEIKIGIQNGELALTNLTDTK